jgi:hypothetical protein
MNERELLRSRKSVRVLQMMEDLYMLNRVGVYPTLGMLARVYNVSRYQAEKAMWELTSIGVARMYEREWRRNSMAHTYALTSSGVAMVKVWLENECVSDEIVEKRSIDLFCDAAESDSVTLGVEITSLGKEAAKQFAATSAERLVE